MSLQRILSSEVPITAADSWDITKHRGREIASAAATEEEATDTSVSESAPWTSTLTRNLRAVVDLFLPAKCHPAFVIPLKQLTLQPPLLSRPTMCVLHHNVSLLSNLYQKDVH